VADGRRRPAHRHQQHDRVHRQRPLRIGHDPLEEVLEPIS
jgi:hypothetical protein